MKLQGTIVDWNAVDGMYTLALHDLPGHVRLRPNDIRITDVVDIDPPEYVAAHRDRFVFDARLAAAMEAENAAEARLDPADLLPYRGNVVMPGVALGVPVYGPYPGFAPHVTVGQPLSDNWVVGQAVA